MIYVLQLGSWQSGGIRRNETASCEHHRTGAHGLRHCHSLAPGSEIREKEGHDSGLHHRRPWQRRDSVCQKQYAHGSRGASGPIHRKSPHLCDGIVPSGGSGQCGGVLRHPGGRLQRLRQQHGPNHSNEPVSDTAASRFQCLRLYCSGIHHADHFPAGYSRKLLPLLLRRNANHRLWWMRNPYGILRP